MTQFSLLEMVCDTVQRSGCAAACSAKAEGAGMHRRGGRGEAAAVPKIKPPASNRGHKRQ